MSTNICYLSAIDLATKINHGELTATEAIEAFLKRIDRKNHTTNAFVTVFKDHARDAAIAADNAIQTNTDLGLLHGVPFAVKDLIPVADHRTTYGSIPLKHHVASTDAIAVRRLRNEGAIVIGKTNTSEFGHLATTDNELFGPTGTPFDPTKTSGGSSGGSAAAVADGLVPIALGTDAGGSIRVPASACGIYGFKPTFGRVPRNTRPNAFIDTHPFTEVGPLTRSVADSALTLDIITGHHETDPFSAPLETTDYSTPFPTDGLRIGYTLDFDTRPVDKSVRDTITDAISTLTDTGFSLEPAPQTVGSLWTDMQEAARVIFQTRMTDLIDTSETAFGVDLTDHLDELTPSLNTMAKQGREFNATALNRANLTRTQIYDTLQEYFSSYDLLLAPTMAVPPFDITTIGPREINGQSTHPYTDWYFTLPFNMTGLPAASLPAGLSSGLPIGLQLIGNRHTDPMLTSVSASIEQSLDWHQHYPP